MATSDGLLSLIEGSLPAILHRLQARQSDMDRYRFLMARVANCDVQVDAEFQRTFNGLYMVRRGHVWRTSFYELFEAFKALEVRAFRDVLVALHRATGRIEASFASKLLATIDARMPVYDSWVRVNMGLKARTGSADERIPALCEDYAQIAAIYEGIVGQGRYGEIRANFDSALPDLRDLSDVKKVDLLLWQSRAH